MFHRPFSLQTPYRRQIRLLPASDLTSAPQVTSCSGCFSPSDRASRSTRSIMLSCARSSTLAIAVEDDRIGRTGTAATARGSTVAASARASVPRPTGPRSDAITPSHLFDCQEPSAPRWLILAPFPPGFSSRPRGFSDQAAMGTVEEARDDLGRNTRSGRRASRARARRLGCFRRSPQPSPTSKTTPTITPIVPTGSGS
jgi:hypothetical protein